MIPVLEEREACAQVVDYLAARQRETKEEAGSNEDAFRYMVQTRIELLDLAAEIIRARGGEKEIKEVVQAAIIKEREACCQIAFDIYDQIARGGSFGGTSMGGVVAIINALRQQKENNK